MYHDAISQNHYLNQCHAEKNCCYDVSDNKKNKKMKKKGNAELTVRNVQPNPATIRKIVIVIVVIIIKIKIVFVRHVSYDV